MELDCHAWSLISSSSDTQVERARHLKWTETLLREHLSTFSLGTNFNAGPAEPEGALHLQTVYIQISWLLHCLSLSMWICISNLDQVTWLAEH